MSEKTYWEKRQEQKYLAGEKKVEAYYKELEQSFEQAKKEIQSVINDFYVKYADSNGVSYADAQKLLSRAEIGELKDFIAKAYKHMGEYNLELNNMSIKARMTRYQALEKQIDAILQQLYSIDYEYKGKELLKEVYSDTYYRTWYNIDQYHGFHQEFAQIDPRMVEELIKYPFNGANFSSRLWKQKGHMLTQLTESITTMIIQGKNPNTISKDFAKKFETKEYEAYRLLHTEGSFIIEQATLNGYEEDKVTKYQILATLDHKTSDICRGKDRKIYDVDKAVVGVNYPPFHIFCRTTTTPYYEDGDYLDDTRMAKDPVTGQPYKVPSDMKYNEWHDIYIKNNPEALSVENKWKNRHSDKIQYDKYKEILGKDIPKTFDKFQELKYNSSEEWETLNQLFRDTNSGKVWLNSEFPTEKSFTKHYNKHLKEYGDITKEEYLNKARTLLSSPIKENIEGFKSDIGFVFRYDKTTNDFAIGRADGYISTLYKPIDGYDHYLEQMEKYRKEG